MERMFRNMRSAALLSEVNQEVLREPEVIQVPIETYPEIIGMVKAKLTARQATEPYFNISMRQALKDVGCNDEQIQGTLQYCSDHGFNYCLDYTIQHVATGTEPHRRAYPPPFACEWGVDQLLSRLWSVRG